jgi:hypothetical protein
LSPAEIPTLHVRDFWNSGDTNSNSNGNTAGANARTFLEATYGKKWRETPLLLKGLWTIDELADSSGSRRLTPQGLTNHNTTTTTTTTSGLVIPYFSDATKVGALKPDAEASVQTIVSAMIVQGRPHKIGSQLLVQSDPSLMDEVAPLDFVRDLFGNHFSKNHLMGNPSRTGWRSWFPGTTTVPVFIANTSPIVHKDKTKHHKQIEDDEAAEGECGIVEGDSGESSFPNPSTETPPTNASTRNTKNEDDKPFTGLHCEPIANVAVQLWGSRTWTLVDPKQSWRIKPSISNDGRSFYPSSVSMNVLKTQIPRYEVTTTPGDALWLPTWTYHKVDYVYHDNENDSDSDSRDDGDIGNRDSSATTMLHEHKLSIGASLFHFRPIDFFRRNPLFALLMMPSMVRELAGIATQ